VHPGDLAGGFSDLEMTLLLYCAGAATANESADGLATSICRVRPYHQGPDRRPVVCPSVRLSVGRSVGRSDDEQTPTPQPGDEMQTLLYGRPTSSHSPRRRLHTLHCRHGRVSGSFKCRSAVYNSSNVCAPPMTTSQEIEVPTRLATFTPSLSVSFWGLFLPTPPE